LTLERELKFEAGNDLALPDLTALVRGGRVVTLPAKRLEGTYFDTADLRLARWGVTLRHRPEDGEPRWTVKVAGAKDRPDLRTRHELDFTHDGPRPPAEAVDLIAAFARGAPLAAVARIVTRRMPFVLQSAEGEPLAEVDDDEVVAYQGRRVVTRFREIEVELAEGADDRLVAAIAKRFRKAGATAPTRASKLLRAVAGDEPLAPEVPVPAVGRRAAPGALAAAAISAGTRRVIVHDPLVRLGLDAEAVHQARVGTRRLRSDIRTFAPFLDAEWAAETQQELGRLAHLLGAVRDADVLGERLRSHMARLPPADAAGAGRLLKLLAAQRAASRDTLMAEMRAPWYTALLDRLVAASQDPPLAAGAERGNGAKAVRAVVEHRWEGVRRRVKKSDGEGEALHAVRIAAKRCRYAAEAGAPVLGPPGEALAKAMADVQTVLGDYHDAAVAEEWLRSAAAAPRMGAPAAVSAGLLVAVEQQEADAAAGRFEASWRAARQAWRAFAQGS
jgi:CHAD domain-containing protein